LPASASEVRPENTIAVIMMPLVRLSKSRANSSMAKMMPASGVLNAADSRAGQQEPPIRPLAKSLP
jgi:hypothetical protein